MDWASRCRWGVAGGDEANTSGCAGRGAGERRAWAGGGAVLDRPRIGVLELPWRTAQQPDPHLLTAELGSQGVLPLRPRRAPRPSALACVRTSPRT